MLDIYTKYNFLILKENKKQLQLRLIKLLKYSIFLQKIKFTKIGRITHTHTILFLLYANYFYKIGIKKKKKKFKRVYFRQFQQYIY